MGFSKTYRRKICYSNTAIIPLDLVKFNKGIYCNMKTFFHLSSKFIFDFDILILTEKMNDITKK